MPLKIPLEDAAVSIINIHAQSHTRSVFSLHPRGIRGPWGPHNHTHTNTHTQEMML